MKDVISFEVSYKVLEMELETPFYAFFKVWKGLGFESYDSTLLPLEPSSSMNRALWKVTAMIAQLLEKVFLKDLDCLLATTDGINFDLAVVDASEVQTDNFAGVKIGKVGEVAVYLTKGEVVSEMPIVGDRVNFAYGTELKISIPEEQRLLGGPRYRSLDNAEIQDLLEKHDISGYCLNWSILSGEILAEAGEFVFLGLVSQHLVFAPLELTLDMGCPDIVKISKTLLIDDNEVVKIKSSYFGNSGRMPLLWVGKADWLRRETEHYEREAKRAAMVDICIYEVVDEDGNQFSITSTNSLCEEGDTVEVEGRNVKIQRLLLQIENVGPRQISGYIGQQVYKGQITKI